jgi:Fic family protein
VSETGDFLPWIEFFLTGAEEQAGDALRRSRTLRDLQHAYRQRVQEARGSARVMQLTDALFQSPVVSRPSVQDLLRLTPRGASLVVDRLVDLGMLTEIGDTWPTLFVAREILDVVEER